MDKEKLKKIKVLYYPYKFGKRCINYTLNQIHYVHSLKYISQNKERVQKKIDNGSVLNVIFVVQYIPGWNKLEPIYTKMLQDSRFNPTIVCVPLNIQNHKLMDGNGNDTFAYFKEHGYEAIDALQTDGSWYDLEKLEPDYLFHSRPYNHFMPEPYTSGEIVKYALICNVIYGTCMTRNGLDVTLNKNYFRDTYTYFAFDRSEVLFYDKRYKLGVKKGIQKCVPFGAIGLEQMLGVKKEKKESQFRKTVLWTPRWSTDPYVGGSNFFNYKDVLMKYAKENQDILFVFRPHPLMFGNFLKTGEMTEAEVISFKRDCEKEKNIVLDESKEYADKFWDSDVLITDASGIVPEYFITEKPIIYCNTSALFEYVQYAKDMINSCYEINNEKELEKSFYDLINNEDRRLDLRLTCINQYFYEVKNSSSNVLNTLGNGDL